MIKIPNDGEMDAHINKYGDHFKLE